MGGISAERDRMNDRFSRGERREPSFGYERGESRDDGDMRLSPDDRPTRFQRAAAPAEPERQLRNPPRRDKRPAGGGGGGGKKRGRRRRRSLFGGLIYWSMVLGLWCVIGVGGVVAYYASQLPPIDQLTVPRRPPNIAILAADGSLLANRGETGGRTITLGEVPPYLPKAFVAIEDRRFYDHFGVDPVGITRAVVNNLRGHGGMQGGSTLTQQLAKNLFLTQERTAARKIQEAILALWLERTYTKDQILELYLNRVYFGSGAYGVEAAAQRYFNKSARSVTIAVCSTSPRCLGNSDARLISPTWCPARPTRCRPDAADGGASTWITRSTAPMSIPSSRLLVATTQRSTPALSSSSTSARCSFETDPWCALASTGSAPAVDPACAIIAAGTMAAGRSSPIRSL